MVWNWECVIFVDGDFVLVVVFVEEIIEGDDCFWIIGDGIWFGFYLNFECVFFEVFEYSIWVVLCDQDDWWDVDKIECLFFYFDEVLFVFVQVRIIFYFLEMEMGCIECWDYGVFFMLLFNEFMGLFCFFGLELLVIVFLFLCVLIRVVMYDYWFVVVVFVYCGICIVDDVVQDYVQYDVNVFGDLSCFGGGSI